MKTVEGLRRPDLLSPIRRSASAGERLLGKLVHFDKRGRTTRAKSPGPGEAQIYLFTGVRYEREPAPVPSKPAGSAARAKRRRV
jgi:hypothetical protein